MSNKEKRKYKRSMTLRGFRRCRKKRSGLYSGRGPGRKKDKGA